MFFLRARLSPNSELRTLDLCPLVPRDRTARIGCDFAVAVLESVDRGAARMDVPGPDARLPSNCRCRARHRQHLAQSAARTSGRSVPTFVQRAERIPTCDCYAP